MLTELDLRPGHGHVARQQEQPICSGLHQPSTLQLCAPSLKPRGIDMTHTYTPCSNSSQRCNPQKQHISVSVMECSFSSSTVLPAQVTLARFDLPLWRSILHGSTMSSTCPMLSRECQPSQQHDLGFVARLDACLRLFFLTAGSIRGASIKTREHSKPQVPSGHVLTHCPTNTDHKALQSLSSLQHQCRIPILLGQRNQLQGSFQPDSIRRPPVRYPFVFV